MIRSNKRKHQIVSDGSNGSDSSYEEAFSGDEVDISSALIGQKRGAPGKTEDDDNDEDFENLIRTSISKRNVRGGTDLLKKTKGKSKIMKGEVGGGSFQSMGLHPWVLRSLTLQGFRIPTPIQRLSIPALLADPPRDLVGMARTGSGKSLAYMVPLVQRLGGRHSSTFGARALILLPSRELALQILKVGKELVRGWHAGDGGHAGDAEDQNDGKKGQSLRWSLIVGGEGLDEQFEMITNNPDVIIATPGRLLHLIVEMNLDLKSVQYVVFDEADRLFEMGFETALTEILHRLPATRQTLLFSATLPKSLVDFAKAGLQNPKLVRLDAESKISNDLKMAFFSVRQAEKDACLLVLLRDVIEVPLEASTKRTEEDEPADEKNKGKVKAKYHEHTIAPHQTIVFTATKHHVEYLSNLLKSAGYAVSHIYGSLDQTARTQQMDQFRRGHTSVLVVTDVAARGIDIPVLENVVNYDFPQGARVFVHRIGRTARAGRQGWAWSFVTNTELPYLLDLELFLGRTIKSEVSTGSDAVYTESLILGPFERDRIDEEVEYIRRLDEENHSLKILREVMKKGQGMYERSKGKASQASYKRTKDMIKDGRWGLVGNGSESGIHPVFLRSKYGATAAITLVEESRRKALLRAVNSFKPAETVLEIGAKGNTETAVLMKQRRKALDKAVQRASLASTSKIPAPDEDENAADSDAESMEMANEEEIAAVFDTYHKSSKGGQNSFRDSEFYMSHYQRNAETEKGYSLRDGATFAEQARNVTFDLAGDEGALKRKRHELTWDKKKKKFIKGAGEGADNVRMVRTESGVKLPASYRSGRFDEWKAKSRVSLPKVGEAESEGMQRNRSFGLGGRKYRHSQVVDARPLDRLAKGYERKVRQKTKKELGADGGDAVGSPSRPPPSGKKGKTVSRRFGGKPAGRIKNELKTVDEIRKARKVTENRRAKNARTSRRKGKR
ncbi:DEAD-domain-containing protein [Sparassis latifolia]